MLVNPMARLYLTPNRSIRYPLIVSPYPNKQIAVTQKRMPASWSVMLNSFSQKTRKVRSSIRKTRLVTIFITKIIHNSQVCFSRNSFFTSTWVIEVSSLFFINDSSRLGSESFCDDSFCDHFFES